MFLFNLTEIYLFFFNFYFRDIRQNLDEIKKEQWQKLDSRQVLIICDKHLDNLQSLPKLVRVWDIFNFTEDHIKTIKVCFYFFYSLNKSIKFIYFLYN